MSNDSMKRPPLGQVAWMNDEIAEISLLLPCSHAAQLESMAHARHLTLGQLLRTIIQDYLTHARDPSPSAIADGMFGCEPRA
jgi:hypothetical protein